VTRRTGSAETQGSLREADSPAADDGGAIFGQPHERKPGAVRENGWSGRKDRNASRKSAPRSGGSRSQNGRTDVRTDRRSSRTGARQRAPRSRRAAVNGQGAATSIGFFPPRWHLTVRWHGADHAPAHAARTRTRSKEPKSTSARSNVRGGSLMQRSRSPTVRRKRLDRKVRPPLKTR